MRVNLNTYLVKKLGVKRALQVETFVMLWSMYRATHKGEDPASIDVLAEELGRNRATVFRWQKYFREAFPQMLTPGELLDSVQHPARKQVMVRQVARWTVDVASS